MSDATVERLPMTEEPHPTQRPAPFFGAGGEGRQEGEAENVEAALLLVESHRRLWCDHYDACLELAAGAGWRGWSCCACPLAAPAPRLEPAWRHPGAAAFR